MSKELATQETQLTAPSNVGSMLSIIERASKDPTIDVEKMERLMQMAERMEARDAKRAFTSDMVKLKAAMPAIQARKSVPNDDGTTRYKFAPLDEIDGKLRPIALQYGFTYSFSEAPAEPGKVTKVCKIQHISGHSEENPFTVRVGKGPPKSSEAQGDGAAATYAQRRALCDAFGIVVESDTDGASPREEGHPITAEQAAELERRCLATKTNRKNFLEFAEVKEGGSFADIMSSRFADCDAQLRSREQKMAAAGTTDKDGNFTF